MLERQKNKIPVDNLRLVTQMSRNKFDKIMVKLQLDDRLTFTEHEYIFFINEISEKDREEILGLTELGIKNTDLKVINLEGVNLKNLWRIRLQHITSLKEKTVHKDIIKKLTVAQRNLSGFGKKVSMIPTINSKYIIFIILMIGIITSLIICKK